MRRLRLAPPSLRVHAIVAALCGFSLATFACSKNEVVQERSTADAAPLDPKDAPPTAEEGDAAPSAERADVAPTQVAAPPMLVDWHHGSFEDALAKAKAQNKLVFMDVGAYWCPPCHQLDEEVFNQKSVADRLDQGYIAVHVDAEKGEGPELNERYDIQAYPTLLVLEASGVEKGRVVDFVPADRLLEALDRIEKGENVLAELDAKAAADPSDVEAAYAAGSAYALAANRDKAEAYFTRVLEADPDDAKGFASQVLYDRAMFITAKLDADPRKAIEEFKELQARFPNSKRALKAYRQIGRQLAKLGEPDAAIASLDAMLAAKPDDVATYSNYGWFSFRQRCHPERGLEVVRQGLESFPDDADLHYVAAELALLNGDRAGALESMKNAARLEPKRAYYGRRLASLESMESGSGAPAADATGHR